MQTGPRLLIKYNHSLPQMRSTPFGLVVFFRVGVGGEGRDDSGNDQEEGEGGGFHTGHDMVFIFFKGSTGVAPTKKALSDFSLSA